MTIAELLFVVIAFLGLTALLRPLRRWVSEAIARRLRRFQGRVIDGQFRSVDRNDPRNGPPGSSGPKDKH